MENIITLPSSLSTQCQYQLQQPNDLFYHNIHIFLQIQHTLLEWHLYSKNTLQTPTVGYCWYTNHHATVVTPLPGGIKGRTSTRDHDPLDVSRVTIPPLPSAVSREVILKYLKKMLKCLGGAWLQLFSSSVFLPFAWLADIIGGERDAARHLPISYASPGTDLR